jgi:hypothetical protein
MFEAVTGANSPAQGRILAMIARAITSSRDSPPFATLGQSFRRF